MPRLMRFTLAAAAMLIAAVCSIGWVLQARAGAGVLTQMAYAAGAGIMIGLAIVAIKHEDDDDGRTDT